jgi:hypothetical protein
MVSMGNSAYNHNDDPDGIEICKPLPRELAAETGRGAVALVFSTECDAAGYYSLVWPRKRAGYKVPVICPRCKKPLLYDPTMMEFYVPYPSDWSGFHRPQ